MADLAELFSRLKSPASEGAASHPTAAPAQQSGSIWATPQTTYQPPSVSSPLFSPPIHTPNPAHSHIMSPNINMSAAQSPAPDQKSANLLNLLRFNNAPQGSQQSPLAALQNIGGQSRAPSGQARNVSASDLVASFHQKPSTASTFHQGLTSPPPSRPDFKAESVTSPLSNPQDFLLNLLNRSKPPSAQTLAPLQSPQPQVPGPVVDALAKDLAAASLAVEVDKLTAEARPERQSARDNSPSRDSPLRVFGSRSRETTPFEAPSPASKSGIFTYVNPFEQLSASTPRTRTPKPEAQGQAPKGEMLKHGRDVSSTQTGETRAKQRKVESSAPKVAPDTERGLSVSEALSSVAEVVDKQVEEALEQAGAAQAKAPKALKKEGKTAEDEVADSWESADLDHDSGESAGSHVEVYNFPMKPFVSIEITKVKQPAALRPDSLMDIARLKKEFDQMDRTLVTASSSHIVYAMSKHGAGGYRVIRQDSGRDKQIFRSSPERVFSVQISHSASKGVDAVLATGINGSVFWTSIPKASDSFDEGDLESHSFILPPVPVQDDNTSGSPVKTRAKLSSRHIDFFGISRGKSIHIVSPLVACLPRYTDKKTRVVDNEKYLGERSFKISTGKAGKDFAFSEDDTLLVSLDKAGRIKFWDIREMAELAQDSGAGKRPAVELKNSLWTLTTTMPLEKASPTSVMFVDKERPCVKGIALRYLIVGLKQNHVLQLWDLGLGKPVQELHFPHDKDSDAICSISYHPKTGIIAVGHPTRNSIYFIHLSAPRYHIPTLDQARYVTMLASEDPNLPKPESTAIMSGIREVSFASKGELRSIDMLKTPASAATGPETAEADATLFELYAMHSKGVTCLNIKKMDLGWNADNKVIHAVDAEEAGVISMTPIRVPTPMPASSETSTAAETPVKSVKPVAEPEPVRPSISPLAATKEEKPTNGSVKAEKKKTPATGVEKTAPVARATNPALITPESYALAAKHVDPEAPVDVKQEAPATPKPLTITSTSAIREPTPAPRAVNGEASTDVHALAESVSSTLASSFSKELESLYRKFDDDKRVQDAASAAKQDAVLRLVSSTLTDNVEKSLGRIVTSTIQQTVVPAITDVTTAMVDRRLSEALAQHLGAIVPQEIKASLPHAIGRAMQDKELLRVVSEHTASKLSAQIEQTFAAVLRNTIIPNFTNLAASTTQKAIADVERRVAEQLRQADVQQQQDHLKIEQLTTLVLGLSETIHEMAAGQSAFQEQILKLQRTGSTTRTGSDRSAGSTGSEVVQSVEDVELQTITSLMTEGMYEEGTIKWLQSHRQGELFDRLFVRCNPQYLQKLTPLVTLSVSAAVSSSFDKNVNERLDWLNIVLSTIDLKDAEITQVAPKIMDVLLQRMQGAYMQIAELNPQDPALRKVASLSRQIGQIKDLTE